MIKKHYEQVDETVYYEKLANGLEVYLMPKKGFNKTYATFTTRYGSIDNHFIPLGGDTPITVPDGIAHFLEHKLFEKEDYDVFQKFSEKGASSNAFTSFRRTAYLFSTTSNVPENLTTLLDFVQYPYFTETTVEKEKGIIEEEIKMYEDNADFQTYFGVLNNLYHNHPIKIDIAGTVESIYQITAEDLHTCYNTFYHPSNMILFVVGDIEPEALIDVIKQNQNEKDYQDAPVIERFFPEEPATVAHKERTVNMQIASPKVYVAVKGVPDANHDAKDRTKKNLALDLLLETLFGSSSEFYETILAEGISNETFSFEVSHEDSYSFVIIGGDSSVPDELMGKIQKILLGKDSGSPQSNTLWGKGPKKLDEQAFNRIKRKKIGRFLSALNSVEFIANTFTEYAFSGLSLFEAVEILENLTFDDVKEVAGEYFADESRMTTFKMMPK